MPDPATDPGPARAPKALAGLAGLACVACCLLPALIAAGVVGGSAAALVGWLPALAAALAALAGTLWWLQRRRSRSCSCRPSLATGGCTCAHSAPASGAHR
jgi:mercuric ion transport protein